MNIKGGKKMKRKNKRIKEHGCGAAVYGFGFIGALVYYLSTATGFWSGVLAVLKSIVWPAMLVFELLKFLAM